MTPEFRPLLILALAMEAIAVFLWMGYTLRKDGVNFPPKRLRRTFIFASLSNLGFILYAVFSLLDPKRTDFGFVEGLVVIGKSLVFTAFVLGKSYAGPLFVGFTLMSTTYNAFEYGEFNPWPVVSDIFEWVFSHCPKWVEWLYFSVAFFYALIATVWDNIADVVTDAGQNIGADV